MENKNRHGISCDVGSCVFNKNECECTADSISVCCTCSDPECCSETQCKTFKSKEH
ncbi:MAG: DUF1540 domain-containing protein [Ruminococcus sp.]|nr:DUF1540 domain-containing protein [Ruminococcus sp.]MBQ1535314.1 DUF1540 domain-containing protein [Ruminococcus sp.]MBQ4247663.1 DUF1540 domain-containing protein [Ruminococcus sp.]